MQKSLTKNSIYNIIYTVVNILFPFATSIYVSRILLPAGVGKVASAQNIVSYFVTLAALGLPSYGVREFAKVREIKMLLRETQQRDDNYNYFKSPMLPSDYRKINSDHKKQLLYKVERETYKYSMNLRNYNLTEKEIVEQTEEYKQGLYKQYGLKVKLK